MSAVQLPLAAPSAVVVGIDCGKDGAVVALDRAGTPLAALLAAQEYVADREYRPKAMAALLRSLAPSLVLLERQHPHPKDGKASAFATGFGFGLWAGILAGLGVPHEIVRAVDWQRVVLRGFPGDDTKAKAVLAAEARIPALDLRPGRRTKPHNGLADAGCLALYGLGRARAGEGGVNFDLFRCAGCGWKGPVNLLRCTLDGALIRMTCPTCGAVFGLVPAQEIRLVPEAPVATGAAADAVWRALRELSDTAQSLSISIGEEGR